MQKFMLEKPNDGKMYKQRIGVYAFIENENKEIAIMKTSKGMFLPGGGLEANETEIECLKRECIEEAEMCIHIIEKFAIGSCFFYSSRLNIPLENKGNFYRARFSKFTTGKIEDDHELVWFDAKEIKDKLYMENQRKAIEIYISKYL